MGGREVADEAARARSTTRTNPDASCGCRPSDWRKTPPGRPTTTRSQRKMIGSPPSVRRSSARARKVAPKVAAALQDSTTRALHAQARLDALESDNAGGADALAAADDEEDASGDEDEEPVFKHKAAHKSSSSGPAKRKTRQAKAAERVGGAQLRKGNPRSFLELLQDAGLETLPPYVPSYLTAAVGPSSLTSRRHFCSVCGYIAPYTCVRCGSRFCSVKCQTVHNDTRCQKFVA